MAQLVEQLLPTEEVCGSNAVISILLNRTFVNCNEKTKIKKKRPGKEHF